MAQHRFTTSRLILRQWEADDLATYSDICADPEVMKYIASGAVLSVDQTAVEIQKMEMVWEAKGFGSFAVEDRETGALLGAAGFSWHDFLPTVSPCVEIGWRLARGAWNRGIATEAAKGALEYGVETLGLSDIYCFCQSRNVASQRIADKIGFGFVGDMKSPSYDRVIKVYRQPEIPTVP